MRRVNLERISVLLGYTNEIDFMLKFVLPIISSSILISLFVSYFLKLPMYVSLLVLLCGIGFLVAYPLALFEKKRINIDENLHLFISYAGTISTMKISRSVLFKRIAQKKVFGEISGIAQKIFYLSKKWNLGFSKTCRKVGSLIPSRILSDFLDRFAIVMDFGEDIETFLVDEQDAIMDEYMTEYKKSLESIKMIQDVFISLTISLAFLIAMALLMPMILGIPIDTIISYVFLSIVGIDVMVFVMIKAFIPSDVMVHPLKIKTEGMKQIDKICYVIVPASLLLLVLLFTLTNLPFLVNVAIGLSPLALIGYKGLKEEGNIMKKDQLFPTFIRTLGSAVEVKGGGMVSSLIALQVHDFGVLDVPVTNLFRRMRLGCDKINSWIYFAGESGSNQIYHFSKIFSESLALGGNGEKIGEIVSKNFSKLLSLRKLRLQLSQSLKGAFYGSLIGFTATLYVSAEIARTLTNLFQSSFSMMDGNSFASSLGSILPQVEPVSIARISLYIGIMVTFHSFMSSIILKIIDGGIKRTAFLDMVLMIWIGAFLSVFIPSMMSSFMPSLGIG